MNFEKNWNLNEFGAILYHCKHLSCVYFIIWYDLIWLFWTCPSSNIAVTHYLQQSCRIISRQTKKIQGFQFVVPILTSNYAWRKEKIYVFFWYSWRFFFLIYICNKWFEITVLSLSLSLTLNEIIDNYIVFVRMLTLKVYMNEINKNTDICSTNNLLL